MAKVTVENGQLVINIEGLRKLGTLKNKLLIPLENVEWAMIDLEAWKNTPKPFQKIAGTDSYGIYFGGTFKQNGKKIFYDLGKKDFAVVIKLKNAKYDFQTMIYLLAVRAFFKTDKVVFVYLDLKVCIEQEHVVTFVLKM